jgi:hypothetical protein
LPAAAPAETPSRKRPRPDDDAAAAENARLQKELDAMRAATQRLEQDLRKAEARADRNGRQRDEARDDADQLRGDVKRLRRERNEARQEATSSERALAALRQKLDRQIAAQRDTSTPARPAKRGRHHYSAEEPVDEARDAAEAEEDASPRQVEGADGNARALSDSVEASDQSFPVGSWVRHAKTGAMGVVVGVSSCGVQSRSVLCVGQQATSWGLRQLQPAPGAPPTALAAVAAARYAKRGDWVRDEQTGKKGIIVEIIPKGWRTILCDDGHELKRYSRSFRLADGVPPASLLAKAAAWSPADAESSEEEGDEVSFPAAPAPEAPVEDAAAAAPPPSPQQVAPPPVAARPAPTRFPRGGGRVIEMRRVGDASWRRFNSQTDASKAFGIAQSEISHLLNNRSRASGKSLLYEARRVGARPPPVEPCQAAPAAGAAHYPVETLVEARFRGGDVFYPALVVAVRDGGRTLDLKYTDGDSEERVPLDLVRPLAARQRSAPAAAVPEAPAAPTSKPEAAAPRWTAEEEKQLRKLVNELGDRESWSAIAARLGSVRSAAACEFHWKYSMKGTIRAAPAGTFVAGGAKACEVRRGNGPWRRFASQTEAARKIPGMSAASIAGLCAESRDGIRRSTVAVGVRGEYEARDYFGDDFEAAKPVARRPPPAAPPAEDATAPSPTSSVSYPVDALVEARWRGGSKYYPAVVLASSASGTTVDLKYVDDSDEEDDVPVEMVRPANRRLLQRYQQCINQIVAALLSMAWRCSLRTRLTG